MPTPAQLSVQFDEFQTRITPLLEEYKKQARADAAAEYTPRLIKWIMVALIAGVFIGTISTLISLAIWGMP